MSVAIDQRLNLELIAQFCRRHKICEMAVFGSALRNEFNGTSDIDLLVTFSPDSPCTLFDELRMEDELVSLLGRKVDLVERSVVEKSDNWIRRKAILESAIPIYVAR